MHTSGTCHQKFRCSKFDDFFDHQIWGVGYKFSSRGFRKFFSPIFLAKNKSFEQKIPSETKNSGLQWFSRIFRHLEKILKTRFSLIFESLGKSLLAIGCSQLTSIPCVWCVQITLFTSWKGYGSTSGTKTCNLKDKKVWHVKMSHFEIDTIYDICLKTLRIWLNF